MKRVLTIILLTLSLLILVSCGGKENNNGGGAQNGDGLSADKTYYQLTDKNGIVIRIPIGKPIGKNADRTAASTSDSSPFDKKIQAMKKEDGGTAEVYVFSEYSIISFGYGAIKNPVNDDAFLKQPSGEPYSVTDDYILVVQCFDKYINSVKPTDKSVKYVCAYILEYDRNNPENIWIMASIDYLVAKDKVESYHKVEGHEYTDDIVKKTYVVYDYDTYTYDCRTDTEGYVTVGGVSKWVTISCQRFNVDGTPTVRHDYTYPSANEMREASFVNDMPVGEIWFKNGSPVKYRYFHENGVMSVDQDFVGSAEFLKEYDTNGNLIGYMEKDNTSDGTETSKVTLYNADGNVIKYTESRYNSDGTSTIYTKDYTIRDEDICEYVDDNRLYKVTEYYFDTEIIESTCEYHSNGQLHIWEKFDENGKFLFRQTFDTNGDLIEDTRPPAFN